MDGMDNSERNSFDGDENDVSCSPEEEFLRVVCEANGLKREDVDQAELAARVEVLEIFATRLTQLGSLRIFTNLRRLEILHQGLTSIQGLEGCASLEHLWLTANCIESMHGLEGCTHLQSLHLDDNKLERVDGSVLKCLPNLHTLSLSQNRLSTLDGVSAASSLQCLNVAGNRLLTLGTTLDELASLTKLNVAGNCLASLQEVFHVMRLPNLRDLSFVDPHYSPANVMCQLPGYAVTVALCMQQLEILDGQVFQHQALEEVSRKQVFYSLCSHDLDTIVDVTLEAAVRLVEGALLSQHQSLQPLRRRYKEVDFELLCLGWHEEPPASKAAAFAPAGDTLSKEEQQSPQSPAAGSYQESQRADLLSQRSQLLDQMRPLQLGCADLTKALYDLCNAIDIRADIERQRLLMEETTTGSCRVTQCQLDSPISSAALRFVSDRLDVDSIVAASAVDDGAVATTSPSQLWGASGAIITEVVQIHTASCIGEMQLAQSSIPRSRPAVSGSVAALALAPPPSRPDQEPEPASSAALESQDQTDSCDFLFLHPQDPACSRTECDLARYGCGPSDKASQSSSVAESSFVMLTNSVIAAMVAPWTGVQGVPPQLPLGVLEYDAQARPVELRLVVARCALGRMATSPPSPGGSHKAPRQTDCVGFESARVQLSGLRSLTSAAVREDSTSSLFYVFDSRRVVPDTVIKIRLQYDSPHSAAATPESLDGSSFLRMLHIPRHLRTFPVGFHVPLWQFCNSLSAQGARQWTRAPHTWRLSESTQSANPLPSASVPLTKDVLQSAQVGIMEPVALADDPKSAATRPARVVIGINLMAKNVNITRTWPTLLRQFPLVAAMRVLVLSFNPALTVLDLSLFSSSVLPNLALLDVSFCNVGSVALVGSRSRKTHQKGLEQKEKGVMEASGDQDSDSSGSEAETSATQSPTHGKGAPRSYDMLSLRVLHLENNRIRDLADVALLLQHTPNLQELDLRNNPVCCHPGYRHVLRDSVWRVPHGGRAASGSPRRPAQRRHSFVVDGEKWSSSGVSPSGDDRDGVAGNGGSSRHVDMLARSGSLAPAGVFRRVALENTRGERTWIWDPYCRGSNSHADTGTSFDHSIPIDLHSHHRGTELQLLSGSDAQLYGTLWNAMGSASDQDTVVAYYPTFSLNDICRARSTHVSSIIEAADRLWAVLSVDTVAGGVCSFSPRLTQSSAESCLPAILPRCTRLASMSLPDPHTHADTVMDSHAFPSPVRLDALSRLPHLTSLNMSFTFLGLTDISPIWKAKNLRRLNLRATSLDVWHKCVHYGILHVEGDSAGDGADDQRNGGHFALRGITSLTRLRVLDLRDNELTTEQTRFVGDVTTLTCLKLDRNRIHTLTHLESLSSLQELYADDTFVGGTLEEATRADDSRFRFVDTSARPSQGRKGFSPASSPSSSSSRSRHSARESSGPLPTDAVVSVDKGNGRPFLNFWAEGGGITSAANAAASLLSAVRRASNAVGSHVSVRSGRSRGAIRSLRSRPPTLRELRHLRPEKMPRLLVLSLKRTPIAQHPEYHLFSVYELRGLLVLDGLHVTAEERVAARERHHGALSMEYLKHHLGVSVWNARRLTKLDFSARIPPLRVVRVIQQSIFPHLRHICLSDNNISDLSQFSPLPELTILQLNGNSISHIPLFRDEESENADNAYASVAKMMQRNASTSGAWAVRHHHVGRGHLAVCFPRLEVLELAFNRITHLGQLNLQGMGSLLVLNLEGNDIQSVEEGLEGLTQLQQLVLCNNKIRHVDAQAFEDLSMLRGLQLEHNSIRSVEALCHAPLVALRGLYLAFNRIAPLNITAHQLANAHFAAGLVELTLHHNAMNRQSRRDSKRGPLVAGSLALGTAAGLSNRSGADAYYREPLIRQLAALRLLDAVSITAEEREKASNSVDAFELMGAQAIAQGHVISVAPHAMSSGFTSDSDSTSAGSRALHRGQRHGYQQMIHEQQQLQQRLQQQQQQLQQQQQQQQYQQQYQQQQQQQQQQRQLELQDQQHRTSLRHHLRQVIQQQSKQGIAVPATASAVQQRTAVTVRPLSRGRPVVLTREHQAAVGSRVAPDVHMPAPVTKASAFPRRPPLHQSSSIDSSASARQAGRSVMSPTPVEMTSRHASRRSSSTSSVLQVSSVESNAAGGNASAAVTQAASAIKKARLQRIEHLAKQVGLTVRSLRAQSQPASSSVASLPAGNPLAYRSLDDAVGQHRERRSLSRRRWPLDAERTDSMVSSDSRRPQGVGMDLRRTHSHESNTSAERRSSFGGVTGRALPYHPHP